MDKSSNNNEVNGLLASLEKQIKKPTAKDVSFKIDVDKVKESNEIYPILHSGNIYLPRNIFNLGIFNVNKKRIDQNKVFIGEDKNGFKYYIDTRQSLNQTDLDIFLIIISMFQGLSRNDSLEISANKIAKKLGKNIGGKTISLIKESITRLHKAKITSEYGNTERIFGFFRDDLVIKNNISSNKIFSFALSSFVSDSILEKSNTCFVPLEDRICLKNDVQKWLHGYVVSRLPRPFNITVKEAIRSSGFTGQSVRFKDHLKKSLKELNKRQICHGYIDKGYDNSKIIFVKI